MNLRHSLSVDVVLWEYHCEYSIFLRVQKLCDAVGPQIVNHVEKSAELLSVSFSNLQMID